jgi:hypothetical protein
MSGQPFDYRMQYVDPTEALMKGIQSGQTLRANDMQLKAAQQKIQDDQLAAQQKAQDDQLAAQQKAMREQQRQDLVAKYLTTGDSSMLPSIIMQFPEMRESVNTMVEVKGEAYKQDQTSFFARVVPALKSGRGDVALDVIKTRVSALEQSGSDPQQLETLKTAQKALESGDQNAIRQIAALAELSLATYDDKYAASMKALGENARADQMQPSTVQKSQAEAQIKQSEAQYANANNQATLQSKLAGIEVALRNASTNEERARLEREKATVELRMKMAKGVDIPPDMRTVQDNAAKQAVAARNAASNSLILADGFSKLPEGRFLGRGYTGFEEWVRSQLGGEDKLTELRQQYKTLRNKLVGVDAADFKPLSNTDLQMLMGGYPDENSSPKYIAKFLRTYAKAQEISARNEEAKTEWISQVGNMGSAKQPIEINGVVVPKGTSYSKYIRSLGGNPTGKPTQSLDDIWK